MKKTSDTPRWSLHSVVDVWLVGWLHFDTQIHMLALTHCHEVTLMFKKFKVGFCRAPGFSRISAVQQQLLVWNHLQNECHELWQCVHISWGATASAHILVWSPLFSSPWPPQHCTMKGSAAAEKGHLSPAWIWGSTCSRRGKWHYPTVLSYLYGSVPTALCTDTNLWLSLLQVFKALTLK